MADELTLDRELEDGLAELVDGFRRVVEHLEVVAQTPPGGRQLAAGAGLHQPVQATVAGPLTHPHPLRAPRLQLVAEGQELIHLHHDSLL